MARHKQTFVSINVPIENADIVLEVLEQTLEDIQHSECDCDDCKRVTDVVEDIVSKILAVSPLKLA